MRVALCGDIHGQWSELEPYTQEVLGDEWKVDLIIVLGDAEVTKNPRQLMDLTRNGTQVALIEGNHDIDVPLYTLPTKEMWGGLVGVLDDSVYHLRCGEVYTIGSDKFLALGGGLNPDGTGYPIDSQSIDRIIHRCLDNTFDFVLSHEAPSSLACEIVQDTDCTSTSKALEVISSSVVTKNWYCGHYHVGWLRDTGSFRFVCLDKFDVEIITIK